MTALDDIKRRHANYVQTMRYEDEEPYYDTQVVSVDMPRVIDAAYRVLNLHYPVVGIHGHEVCAHRHCKDDAEDQCRWPCMTARALWHAIQVEP